MLTYEYRARDKTGNEVKAEVEADSEQAAAKLLTREGFSPLEIKLKGSASSGLVSSIRNHIGTKDKVLFSRQLSTLINAGLPLVQSLRTVSEQTQSKALQLVISKVIASVEAGTSFADSLSKHPKVFNTVFVSLIAAGEASGTLDKALERLANQQEKDAEILAKVRGAMVYPAIVLIVILAVVIFMLTTVLPQVEILYDDLNKNLPAITAGMLVISRFITNYWYVVIIALIGAIIALRNYLKTTGGRSFADHFKMHVPIFKRLFMKMYMARFCRTGTTLTSSGVPMLQMMSITGDAINNVHIKASIDKASEKVKAGKSLSESLTDDPNFLRLVPQMLRIGEQSGSLDKMLEKTASFYEKELDNEIKAISTTIEPILMVVLALVAGLMVGAVLIPVYGLVGQSLA